MINNLKIGQFVQSKRTFTSKDVETFSLLSNDINPIHIDKKYASDTIFGDRIVHGIFVSSIFSALIANELPGPGSIYLSQDLKFHLPIYHNEEVLAKVKIIKIRSEKSIITLDTTITNKHNKVAVSGTAVVKWMTK
jgi:3-hydroxybutyryl-CoA dehydratase